MSQYIFTPISKNNGIKERLGNYNLLQQKLNDFISEENIENVNYFSEVMFSIVKNTAIINMQQIKINERLWILDGEHKINSYKKNNVEIDNERIFLFNDKVNHPDEILQIENNTRII